MNAWKYIRKPQNKLNVLLVKYFSIPRLIVTESYAVFIIQACRRHQPLLSLCCTYLRSRRHFLIQCQNEKRKKCLCVCLQQQLVGKKSLVLFSLSLSFFSDYACSIFQ